MLHSKIMFKNFRVISPLKVPYVSLVPELYHLVKKNLIIWACEGKISMADTLL